MKSPRKKIEQLEKMFRSNVRKFKSSKKTPQNKAKFQAAQKTIYDQIKRRRSLRRKKLI